MPKTQKARDFMCAVCGGRAKLRPGQKLPSKAVACEQCTATIKKALREEIEREPPTKRFLVKMINNLSGHLPSHLIQESMRKARGHAGGAVKMTKAVLKTKARKELPDSAFAIPESRKYPIHDEAHARNALARVAAFGSDDEKSQVRAAVKRRYPKITVSKAELEDDEVEFYKSAGILAKSVVGYRNSKKEEMRLGLLCSSCAFFGFEGDVGGCDVVGGAIQPDDLCDLWRPAAYFQVTAIKSQPDSRDVHVDGLLPNDDDVGLCMFKSEDNDGEDGD